MQLPSVDAVNDTRVARFMERISQTLAGGDTDFYRDLVQRYENEHNVPMAEIAAALARQMQGDTPFLLTPPVRERRQAPAGRNERPQRDGGFPRNRDERGDRGERPARFEPRFERAPRHDDGERAPRPPRGEGEFERAPRREMPPRSAPEFGMETYRIEVGHMHGVKPANIVGAIANEAGLESRYIGRIDIHDGHSVLDLPADMPGDVLQHLKKVWVSGQQLQMRKVEPGEEQGAAPSFKPRFGKGPKPAGRPGGPRSAGPGGPGGPPRRDGFKPRGPRGG